MDHLTTLRNSAKRATTWSKQPGLSLVLGMFVAASTLYYIEWVAPAIGINHQWYTNFEFHVLDYVVFLLPVSYVAFKSGLIPGLASLAIASAIMLPRALWGTDDARIALGEMMSVVLVSLLICLF